MIADEAPAPVRRVKIWDWPTRLTHWLFVLLIPLAWWTAEQDAFDWHKRIGLLLLTLLLFRILWGFVGSSTARFADFLRGPAATWRYLKGIDGLPKRIGHNPLGAWSVIALLSLMLSQVVLGLFAVDVDGLESGPLSDLIGFDASRVAADLHEITFNLLLAFIALHVGAILFYALVRRTNLVGPMVSGAAPVEEDVEDMAPAAWPRLVLASLVAVAMAWWVSEGAPLP